MAINNYTYLNSVKKLCAHYYSRCQCKQNIKFPDKFLAYKTDLLLI